MKKIHTTAAFLLTTLLALSQGQFKIRNDQFIQIGYETPKSLTFGQGTALPNNGNFALEYCSTCVPSGLNIWKPYPTAGFTNYLLFIRDNGNTGIGNMGDASARLWISGNLKLNAVIHSSDKRLAENLKPIDGQLDKLMKIKTYQYRYTQNGQQEGDSLSVNVNKEKTANYNFDDNTHFGIMAQDIEKLYPNLVSEDEQGYLGVNYAEFVPLLIQAIQEQNEKIAELEEELKKLKRKKRS